MKSPDEIKKGLECCAMYSYRCEDDCPYREQCRNEQGGKAMNEDALALIQQLESERNAIMQDMNKNCTSCKHSGMNNPDNPCYKFEEQCRDYSNWQWRGVQKEE